MWGGGGTWEAGEDSGGPTSLYVLSAGPGTFIPDLFKPCNNSVRSVLLSPFSR